MAAQIIQFPVQHSNGYNNLIQLFEICSSLESCNFYLESVEQLFQKGYITDKDFCTPGHYRVGWNEYRVTNKAFDKLKEQYTISQEVCLD